jgi:hypothetical protein
VEKSTKNVVENEFYFVNVKGFTKMELCKTLSEHHWIAGANIMKESKQMVVKVCSELSGWVYLLCRDNPKTTVAYRYTYYNGKLMEKTSVKL